MRDMRRPKRPLLLALGACVLVALVAIPVLAAGPRGPLSSASPAASAAPLASAAASSEPARASSAPERVKPSKAPKPERAAQPESKSEASVTLTGKVGTRTNADGDTEYTLTVGARTLVLEAGPSWYYGDKHPLKPFVGKTVTVVGEQEAGKDEIDVRSVDGTVIRADGKPPWAGGWKRVGKNHPGWSQEKWDKWQAKVAEKKAKFGIDCWPPGLCTTPGTTGSTTDQGRSGGD